MIKIKNFKKLNYFYSFSSNRLSLIKFNSIYKSSKLENYYKPSCGGLLRTKDSAAGTKILDQPIKNFKNIKNNNKISKKESFFQYLFVHYVISKKKITNDPNFLLKLPAKAAEAKPLLMQPEFEQSKKELFIISLPEVKEKLTKKPINLKTSLDSQKSKISEILDKLNSTGYIINDYPVGYLDPLYKINNYKLSQEPFKSSISRQIGCSASIASFSNLCLPADALKKKAKNNLRNYSENYSNFWKEGLLTQNKILINYKKPFLSYWLLPFLGLISLLPTCIRNNKPNNLVVNSTYIAAPTETNDTYLKTIQMGMKLSNYQNDNKNLQILSKNYIGKDYSLFLADKNIPSKNFLDKNKEKNPIIHNFLQLKQFPSSIEDDFIKYKEIMDLLLLSSLEINKQPLAAWEASLAMPPMQPVENKKSELNVDFSKFSLAILNKNIRQSIHHRYNFNWYWYDLNQYLNKNLISYKNFFEDLRCFPARRENIPEVFFPKKLSPVGTSNKFVLKSIINKTSFFLNTISSEAKQEKNKSENFITDSISYFFNQKSIKKQEVFRKKASIYKLFGFPCMEDMRCFPARRADHAGPLQNTNIIEGKNSYFIGVINDKTLTFNRYLKKNNEFSKSSFIEKTTNEKSLAASQASPVFSFLSDAPAYAHVLKKKKQVNFINNKITPYKSRKKALLLMDEILLNLAKPIVRQNENNTKYSCLLNTISSDAYTKKKSEVSPFEFSILKAFNEFQNFEIFTDCFNTLDDNFLQTGSYLNNFFGSHKNSQPLEKMIHIILKNKKNPIISQETSTGPTWSEAATGLPLPRMSSDQQQDQQSIELERLTLRSHAAPPHTFVPPCCKKKKPINLFFRKDILYNSIFEGLKNTLNTILDNKTLENYPILNNNKSGIFTLRQQFSSEINSFKNIEAKNRTLIQFNLIPINQNKLRKLNILKLNHPIRGGYIEAILQPTDFNLAALPMFEESPVFSFPKRSFTPPAEKEAAAAEPVWYTVDPTMQEQQMLMQGRVINENKYLNLEKTLNIKENLITPWCPVESILKQDKINFKSISNKKKLSTISISKVSDFDLQNLKNKNSFLFLSKYINILTANIKKTFTPYKSRLTYFPEISMNLRSPRGILNNSIMKKNFPSQAEKIFLSYLSRVKKPFKKELNSDSAYIIPASIKSHAGLPALSYQSKSTNFKNLKLKSKYFLKTKTYNDRTLNFRINVIKNFSKSRQSASIVLPGSRTAPAWKTISSETAAELIMQPQMKRDEIGVLRRYGNKIVFSNTLNTANTKIFLSKQINFLKLNQLAAKINENYSKKESDIAASIFKNQSQATNLKAGKNKGKILQSNKQNKTPVSKNFLDILEKKQNLKIKRRLKKMKKETRRRKKRKIFYPRPKWITFSLYKNFLNNRYLFESPITSSLLEVFTEQPQQPHLIKSNFMLRSKKLIDKKNSIQSKRYLSSLFCCRCGGTGSKENGKMYSWTPTLMSASLKKEINLNEGQTKDFYRTSSTVFFDLKRILMKSNWLRSYLNPYFDKVKNIYKEMQTSSKKMEVYLRIRNFILNFYGYESGITIPSSYKDTNLKFEISAGKAFAADPLCSNHLNSLFLTFNKINHTSNLLNSLLELKLKNSSVRDNYADDSSLHNRSFRSTIQKRFNIIEYNRIIYQRFQRIILSIKDNLNLNGDIKNRSKKLGKNIRPFIKRDYKSNGSTPNQAVNPNQKSSFWSKFVKNNILKMNTYTSYGYNGLSPHNTNLNVSKNNLFWALNKTNTSASGTIENFYNFPKKLWDNYKIREISKSNKTKKIIFNLFNKYGLGHPGGSNRSKSLEGFNHIFQQIYNNNIENINTVNKSVTLSVPISDLYQQLKSKKSNNILTLTSPQSDASGHTMQTAILGDISPTSISLNNYLIKSEQKLTNIENKLKLLGLYSKKIEKTYKNSYFRSLKQQLINASDFFYTKQLEISTYKKINEIRYLKKSNSADVLEKAALLVKQPMMPTMQSDILFKDIGAFKQNKRNILKISNEKNNINSFSSLNNYYKISNNYSYWWILAPLRVQYLSNTLPRFEKYETSLLFSLKLAARKQSFAAGAGDPADALKKNRTNLVSTKEKLNKVPLTRASSFIKFELLSSEIIFSLLFHFCTLVSFISLGGIRTLIKFYYILISKTSKLISQISFMELFRPSIFLNNFQEKQRNFSDTSLKSNLKNNNLENLPLVNISTSFQPIGMNGIKDTGGKIAAFSRTSASHKKNSLQIKFFFLQCIIARNRITKFKNNNLENLLSSVLTQSFGDDNVGQSIPGLSILSSKTDNFATINLQDKVKTKKNYRPAVAKKAEFNLNKGWSTSKIKNSKFLDGGFAFSLTHAAVKQSFAAGAGDPADALKEKEVMQGLNLGWLASLSQIMRTPRATKILNDLKQFNNRFSYFNSKAIATNIQDNLKLYNSYKDVQISHMQLPKKVNNINDAYLIINKYRINLIYLSLFKISSVFYAFHKTSFYTYFLLLKSIDLFAIPISFIYKFFEKPGEYVVENLAYNFLVEWSADLITTIPDTVDITTYSYFSKFNRNITPFILLYNTFGFSSLLNGEKKKLYLDPLLWGVPLAISNSILKRLLNSTLLLFIQQLYEPDVDSIIREKKGIIFWDIWGEYLKEIAEENSINIYELTTDKEEQIKLLSKYEEVLLRSENSYMHGASPRVVGAKQSFSDSDTGNISIFNDSRVYATNFIKPGSKNMGGINGCSAAGDPTTSIASVVSLTGGVDKYFNQVSKKGEVFRVAGHLQGNTIITKIKSLKLLGNNFNSTSQIQNKQSKIIKMRRISSSLHSTSENSLMGIKTNSHNERNRIGYNKSNDFGWSASQFLSYQGKDTDLFIDLHPPKSFWSMPSIKYSYSVQQPIGLIVCQIFSGIFYKQISKNILIVGSASLEKSTLIQAMAGETELKMITDNANRYAMVYRGVAVGIKLLRDVFEALSVHTPCIFLMEDIHIIGERRPFLIDETSANDDASYNKNQSMQGILLKEKSSGSEGAREVLYRSTKHLLSHYKKPYKEPKSLATNHFSFTFLFSNIPGRKGIKTRDNFFKPGGAALPVQVIKKENELKYKITDRYTTNKNNQNNYFFGSFDPFNIFSSLLRKNEKSLNGSNETFCSSDDILQKKIKYSSSLEIKADKSQPLAPPASSPFSVLILKEEKKLKHKKLVKEIPWFGLPGEQFSLVSKYNYSTRIKIALLADLVLSNLSVKLDMITDLLVIIDSVKGNRGFVVFATTHIPSILDPALRRPGRFDETINLPLISTLFSRWSNYRYNVKFLSSYLYKEPNYCFTSPLASTFNKGVTIDLFKSNLIIYDQNILTQSCNELINYINKKNSIFNKKVSVFAAGKQNKTNKISKIKNHFNDKNFATTSKEVISAEEAKQVILPPMEYKTHTSSHKLSISNKQLLKLKSRNYSFACKSLISLLLFSSNSSLKWISILKDSNFFIEDYSLYLTMFGNPLMLKIILMSMIGGKIGESFILHSLKRGSILNKNSNLMDCKVTQEHQKTYKIENEFLFDFDNTWRQASSLLLSYLQKRQCAILTKNITLCGYSKGINKLLSFNNKYSLMEPPSPPITNILLPSKRYENYKKTFNNQYETNIANKQNSFSGSVLEKLQFHQQQRLLRRLYKYPIKEFFKSEILNSYSMAAEGSAPGEAAHENQLNSKITTIQPKQSNFNSSYLTLAPLEKISDSKHLINLSKISSTNWCYKNILYNRHRTYLTNQWWNGQQGEHNAETTFLSDIDWRYTFVQSIGDINIDFPDAEQFYNPRNRRWFIDSQNNKNKWAYWFNIESDFKDIYSHYIYECFTKAFKFLNQNREIIDFYAETLHQVPSTLNLETGLNERELLNIYKRFSGCKPLSE